MRNWRRASGIIWLASSDLTGIDHRAAFVERAVQGPVRRSVRRAADAGHDEAVEYKWRMISAGRGDLLDGTVLRVHVDAIPELVDPRPYLVHARELRDVRPRRHWRPRTGRPSDVAADGERPRISLAAYLSAGAASRRNAVAQAVTAVPGQIGSRTQVERTLERVLESATEPEPVLVEVDIDDLGRVVRDPASAWTVRRIRCSTEPIGRGAYLRILTGGRLHAVVERVEISERHYFVKAFSVGHDASHEVLQARADLASGHTT